MKITNEISRILSAVPKVCGAKPNLDILRDTPLGEIFKKMANTPQNPIYHGEGDVFLHTVLTLEMLCSLSEYEKLSEDEKTVVFLATLLHDIGKITCTRVQGSEIVSPHHASSGATMARELLWKDFGLAGSEWARNIREAVCFIIKYHSYPPFAPTEKNAERKLLSRSTMSVMMSSLLVYDSMVAEVIGRMMPAEELRAME